jgi:hypothetical protein
MEEEFVEEGEVMEEQLSQPPLLYDEAFQLIQV